MANKMLIDASHPEETRVVVVRGNRIEEFDFEAENKKQLRGNIYLAKVTRVEPSLQAAFVDYGGNRHGFLAFSEIHPDYYQIPQADRQMLLDEEEFDEDDQSPHGNVEGHNNTESSTPLDNAKQDAAASDVGSHKKQQARSSSAAVQNISGDAIHADIETDVSLENSEGQETSDFTSNESDSVSVATLSGDPHQISTLDNSVAENDNIIQIDDLHDEEGSVLRSKDGANIKAEDDTLQSNDNDLDDSDDIVESVGADDAMEEIPIRSRQRTRQYKIQEVIKRRQILLIQVVKEERGNKGAALTTYLSLAGRYSVLMPNTARGGGISRKITNLSDRKRLKSIANELDVPEGMGVILRTAGASRTKAEVRRDFEYLLRLWENVRDLTLQSSAPTLVYEEGSLIKRAIRDLYNRDIDEILVSGDEGYREAKSFMRMLIPSHAKNVQPYRDDQPVFTRYSIEAQLDAMFLPQVTLKSGGYIVINQTEALVSIDVNSGRSTREHNIEDTAVSTNLEAASEIARQLRLRDLAGLIVIDFIDMEEKRNNSAVERRMKDCLKSDRARIQVGRISHFGLLEMSRQRIRTGVLESTMELCETCRGIGFVRAPSSVSLHVLRAIEDYLLRGIRHDLIVRVRTEVALYILNQKRSHLIELENRFGSYITLLANDSLNGEHYTLEKGALRSKNTPSNTQQFVQMDTVNPLNEEEEEEEEKEEKAVVNVESDDGDRKKRRRRRKRSGGDGDDEMTTPSLTADEQSAQPSDAEDAPEQQVHSDSEEDDSEDEELDKPKKRRRGRRGGRRRKTARDENNDTIASDPHDSSDVSVDHHAKTESKTPNDKNGDDTLPINTLAAENGLEPDFVMAEVIKADNVITQGKALSTNEAIRSDDLSTTQEHDESKADEISSTSSSDETEDNNDLIATEDLKPRRSGWWQRKSFF